MDTKKIREIVKLFTESNLAELELKEGEETLKITSSMGVSSTIIQQAPQSHVIHANPSQIHMQPMHVANEASLSSGGNLTQDSTIKTASHYTDANCVKSPMVGTFYRASSPSSAPFVDIGSEVKVGQVLCIIEAMKLMNQIESDKAGVVKQILIKDGSPVEYGQELFVIE